MSRKPTKRNTRDKRRKDSEDTLDTESSRTAARTKSKSDNDPMWYALTPSLLRDSASLPFSNATGLPFTAANTEGTLPGVMGIAIRLVPGTNDFSDSPINVAARNIYSWVRHANSGSRNYDSPNLMMYLMAMDSLYAIYSHCARMYGLLRVYAQKNRYYPRAFFETIGWDYDDFVANIAQFRLWLNTFVERVGSMCVPANMTFMLRHMWMFQNIWLDGATTKAQSYFFFPQEILRYEYDKDSSEFPIQLKAVRIAREIANISETQTLLKFANIRAYIDDAVQSILSKEDLAIMSGDILKAYGDNGIWRLMPIHEDFVVLPTYSQEVMYQIHNLTCCGGMDMSLVTGKPNVYIAEYADSVTNSTWLKTLVAYNYTAANSSHISQCLPLVMGKVRGPAGMYREGTTLLDFHHEDVTPEDVMVGTRLTAAFDTTFTTVGANDKDGVCCAIAGSEVALAKIVLRYSIGTDGKLKPSWTIFGDNANGVMSTAIGQLWMNTAQTITGLFACAPLCYNHLVPSYSGKTVQQILDTKLSDLIGSIENYTGVKFDTLKNLHNAALMSEFYVPQMGAIGNRISP